MKVRLYHEATTDPTGSAHAYCVGPGHNPQGPEQMPALKALATDYNGVSIQHGHKRGYAVIDQAIRALPETTIIAFKSGLVDEIMLEVGE